MSSSECAVYAHDSAVRLLHYGPMDVQWFKSRKADRKVTDKDLAEALGVDRTVANRVVNGNVRLDAYRVDKVARLLAATPEETLYRAGVPISPPSEKWRPTEDTIRLVLESGLLPLTAADVQSEDFELLVRAVTKGLQLVAAQPSMQNDPGFRKAVEATIAAAIDDDKPAPAQAASST